jgi:hypothetical protein
MDDVTRRTAGGIFTAARAAGAETSEPVPQPLRPGRGGTDPGPRNLAKDRQNPDLLVPPLTDHGTLPNLRFSFSDSHVRQETDGWIRQVTVRELGISKNIAGMNMRLNAGGIRTTRAAAREIACQQPAESSGGRGSRRGERWYDCGSLADLTGGPLQTLRMNGRTPRGPLLKSRAKGVFRGGRMPCACCARARPRPSNHPSLPGHRRPGRARSG